MFDPGKSHFSCARKFQYLLRVWRHLCCLTLQDALTCGDSDGYASPRSPLSPHQPGPESFPSPPISPSSPSWGLLGPPALNKLQNPSSHLILTCTLRVGRNIYCPSPGVLTWGLRGTRWPPKVTQRMEEELGFRLRPWDLLSAHFPRPLMPSVATLVNKPPPDSMTPSGVGNGSSFLRHSSQLPPRSLLLSLKSFLQRLLQLPNKLTS